jgi:protein RecA
MRLASAPAFNVGRLRSGILAVDMALAGGFLISRGHMLYGHKSAGKSTLSLIYAKCMQRMFPDMTVVYLDVEGTFDPAWAIKLGVDITRLLVVEPESGEHAVDLADAVIRAAETSMLIVDSIAMLTPMKEITDSAEQSLPGIHARLMGNMLRRATNALLQERHRGHTPTIMYLNQFRMSIGVTFGDPRVIPGGQALGFAVTQQMELSNKEQYANKKERFEQKTKKGLGAQEKVEALSADDAPKLQSVIANEHTFKVTKDKTGGRIKEGMFRIIRDESTGKPVGFVDQANTIIQVGLMTGQFTGSKQSFDIPDFGNFRGAPALTEKFISDPEVQDIIVDRLVGFYREKWNVT